MKLSKQGLIDIQTVLNQLEVYRDDIAGRVYMKLMGEGDTATFLHPTATVECVLREHEIPYKYQYIQELDATKTLLIPSDLPRIIKILEDTLKDAV